ncbi:MAG TPA: TPM domain-containing protein [Polyangiaceae bacterium]|nr:TPM domain-containing protein [Polyangiaceae bacterium]
MRLLTESECKRIESAIGELEKRTEAEVVVAVVRRSTQTTLERALVAFAVALVAGLAWLEALPRLDARYVLVVELAVGFAAFAFFGLRALERLLVSRSAARRQVEQHASALFARHGLYRTRSQTGVLLLVSELERQVVILGDKAIDARLGQTGWQAHIDHLVAAIRRGVAAQGILEVLERLGAVLAEVAPAEEQNDDELPNTVIQEP